MDHKKKRFYIQLMLVGGLFLIFGGFVGLVTGTETPHTISVFIIAGFVMALLAGIKLFRGDAGMVDDERVRKIGAWGLSYSWFLTFIVLFLVFWVNELTLVDLDARTVTVGTILLMGVSAKCFQWYLFRKGDVE